MTASEVHRLPLPAEAPMQFRILPEYFLENITEYFDFLMRHVLNASNRLSR